MQRLLTEALHANQLLADDATQHKMLQFLQLMQKWNRVFNLTNITDPREMVYLHLIDSLLIQPYLHGERMLDVGTGAGLPGIPLAITNPQRHWVLLDKNQKKTRFLTQVVAELGLKNIEIITARCEDFHPSTGFDSILSRAYSSLTVMVEQTRHLLNPSGNWVAMKGKYPQDELSQLPKDIGIKTIAKLDMKGMSIERCVACLFCGDSLTLPKIHGNHRYVSMHLDCVKSGK